MWLKNLNNTKDYRLWYIMPTCTKQKNEVAKYASISAY